MKKLFLIWTVSFSLFALGQSAPSLDDSDQATDESVDTPNTGNNDQSYISDENNPQELRAQAPKLKEPEKIQVECNCADRQLQAEEARSDLLPPGSIIMIPPITTMPTGPMTPEQLAQPQQMQEENAKDKLPPGYIEKLPPGYSNRTIKPIGSY